MMKIALFQLIGVGGKNPHDTNDSASTVRDNQAVRSSEGDVEAAIGGDGLLL